MAGGKKVFSIDINPKLNQVKSHPMVEFVAGSSTDPKIVKAVRKRVSGKVMVSLDSDHRTNHVAQELELWSPLVSVGQYIVVEDSWDYSPDPKDPWVAVEAFLAKHDNFERMPVERKYIFGVTRDGWLLKKRL